MDNAEANELAADFVRRKIRATVKDPDTAEKLCPKDHPHRHKAAVRRHGLLRDLQPAQRVTGGPQGRSHHRLHRKHRQDARQHSHELDTLVLATGFDAMTGALTAIDIRGRSGVSLNASLARGCGRLSWDCHRGLSQHVCHHRARQPVGARQCRAGHRTARGMAERAA